jgi:hypothetical protein
LGICTVPNILQGHVRSFKERGSSSGYSFSFAVPVISARRFEILLLALNFSRRSAGASA